MSWQPLYVTLEDGCGPPLHSRTCQGIVTAARLAILTEGQGQGVAQVLVSTNGKKGAERKVEAVVVRLTVPKGWNIEITRSSG